MSDQLDHPLQSRLDSPSPKRILALDGGGIRGAITLGFLHRMETLLRKRHGNPNLLLKDYFDLIGGTSTGSIIAASLAIGMDTASILDAYGKMGGEIFERPAKFWQLMRLIRQNLLYKNRPSAIEETLRKFYATKDDNRELTLGDPAIQTGLVIVAKRVDTFSVWPLHNNPQGRYYKSNKDIPLWRAVRASSAAPTFFPPTIFQFDNTGKQGAFIDGGVSVFNNPAMLLYLMSTLKGFNFNWNTGAEKLMIVSIGTGTTDIRYTPEEVAKLGKKNALFWASTVPDMFIRDCNDYNELLLQSLSASPTARKIDSEVRELHGDFLAGEPKMHYVRYNSKITEDDILQNGALTAKDPKKFPKINTISKMMQMDAGDHVHHLAEIGKRGATLQINDSDFEAHFPRIFDLPKANS